MKLRIKLYIGGIMVLFIISCCIHFRLKDNYSEFEKKAEELSSIQKTSPVEYSIDQLHLDSFVPNSWDKIYVLSSLPTGFEVYKMGADSFKTKSGNKEYVIWYNFFHPSPDENDKEFQFLQSNSREYDNTQSYLIDYNSKIDSKIYYSSENNTNIIYWFEDDYTYYLKDCRNNMTFDELIDITNRIMLYN